MKKIIDILLNIFREFSLHNKKPVQIDNIEEYTEEESSINITVNKKIRTKYKKGWIRKIRKKAITEITIHGTGGGTTMFGFLKWMYNGERASNYYKGISLFHYIIDKQGNIVEVIDPNYWVYHSTSGGHAKREIGIELLNSSKSNRNKYTEEQYKSLIDLIEYLSNLYPSIKQITSHRYNIWRYNRKSTARKYDKACPGKGFDWNVLKKYFGKKFKIYHT